MMENRQELDNAAHYWLSIRAGGTEVYCVPVRIREHIFALGYATQKSGEAFRITRRGYQFLQSPDQPSAG